MATQHVERRLAAILAADVAGYSRLMGEDEERTLAQLKAVRREVADPKIKEHQGRIVKTTGDGLLLEFASVVDAVRCGVEVQREMAERNANLPPDRRIELRMGINVGDVIGDRRDIYGDGVNIAARLVAFAEHGGICISRVVRDRIRDKLRYNSRTEASTASAARSRDEGSVTELLVIREPMFADSPLEGDGFEPSVPRRKRKVCSECKQGSCPQQDARGRK